GLTGYCKPALHARAIMIRPKNPTAQRARGQLAASCAVLLVLAGAAAGCGRFGETSQRGYILPEGALEQIPLGATQEQVLIVLGTPSTVATVSGEVFYYISQKTESSVR